MNKHELSPIETGQLHLDLFELDPLLDKNFSNTIEIYDLAGKYIYDKQNKFLKTASADQMEYSRITTYKDREIHVSITAANIEKVVNGRKERMFVFPGTREEIVEDVLRKIATQRGRAQAYEVTNGDYSGDRYVAVSFSIYEVYTELKRVGKSYSYEEIREALTILNRSILTVKSADDSIDLTAPFFPIKAIANKADPKDTVSFVCFHPLITEAIVSQNFRRLNYAKALSFNSPYTRLMYKRLSHRWYQAAPGKPYKIKLSTLVSAMKTPYKSLFSDKALFMKVFKELAEANVISDNIEPTPKKEGKKVVDWLFTLHPTNEFAKQQAANNKVVNSVTSKSILYLATTNPDSDNESDQTDYIDTP